MASELAIELTRQRSGSARGGGRFVSRLAGAAIAVGFLAVFVFASPVKTWADYGRTVAGLAMIALSAWSVGVLVGFLFGLPRVLSVPADGVMGAERSPDVVHYRVNTNLEQISDWLTKILVGVGLAELHRLPAALRGAADYFAAALGAQGPAQLSGFVLALLVYFSLVGFMTGYLGTRVLLAPLFKLADRRDVRATAGTAATA